MRKALLIIYNPKQLLSLVRTVPVVHGERHDVPHALHSADKHAEPVDPHPPPAVGTAPALPEVQEPLDGTHVHPPPLDLLVELAVSPLSHRPPEELADARAQEVERMALAGPVVGLGHVERLDLEGPVGDEYERAGLPSVLDGLLALALGDRHVAEVLHQDLLVLGTEIVLVAGELLVLDPLPYQVDGVAVLDPHERPVHALP